MELILIKDVENLGFKDDVVTVKPGYGRNFLIPQGFARLATTSAKKVLAENLRQRAHKEADMIAEANKMAEKLRGLTIKLEAKVGQDGKLFGSISNQNLAEELANNGVEVDRKFIQIFGGLIKTVGNYQAKVRLHREVTEEINFDVVATNK